MKITTVLIILILRLMISYKPLFKFVILVTVFAIYSDFCSQVITTQRSVTHDSLRYINILTYFIYMH